MPRNLLTGHRTLLLALAAVVGCAPGGPMSAVRQLPTDVPATGLLGAGQPPDEPVVVPFDGVAGQEVRLRARPVEGEAPVLCLASAEAWERVRTGEGTSPADDLAGDALTCDLSPTDGASTVTEVLPRDGQYVAVVTDARGMAPGLFYLDTLPSTRTLTPLADAVTVADTLGADRPWTLRTTVPIGVHFVRGRAGARLDVRAESAAFATYVEVGAWYDEAYAPLVGASGALGDTARATVVLPADGVYTIRVRGDQSGGPYSIRAAQTGGAERRLATGGDPAGRYALIVSVADYPGLGRDQRADLVGPRADGEAVRDLLIETYGFRPEDIVTLRDAEATREAVVKAFRTHLGQAGPEGTAFFHYAGHGTQLPTEALPAGLSAAGAARAEADGLEEALVLWGRGADYGYLLDHELGALAEGLTAGHTVVVLDNCHSGDGTRGEGRTAALRQLPFDAIAGQVDVPDRLLPEAGGVVGAQRHVLLAAARAEQPSLELDGLAPDGGRAGVFTTLLVAALRDAAPDASFADVMAGVRARAERLTRTEMAEYGYEPQSPQVEGAQAGSLILDALGR